MTARVSTAGEAFRSLELARAQTVRLAAPLSQPQLDFTPRAGRWSIGEVLDHLLLAEGLYRGEILQLVELARAGRRPYLRRTFNDINVSPLFLPDALLSWLETPFTIMNHFVPDALRDFVTEFPFVPTRNPDRATPRPRRAGIELRSGLLSSMADTRAIITANADLDFGAMVSEHPLTGPSTVPQILAFLARHERRHQTQIAGVSGDRRFPSS
jgi:uncharacterized damage-inducible protein DinB